MDIIFTPVFTVAIFVHFGLASGHFTETTALLILYSLREETQVALNRECIKRFRSEQTFFLNTRMDEESMHTEYFWDRPSHLGGDS